MDTKSETKKLAEATASLAGTILEIIEARLKPALEAQAPRMAAPASAVPVKALEGWVSKKELARHCNISVRTVDNWIKKGLIPHIRLGTRRLRFKLSDVDEALKRSFQRNGRW